MKKRYMNKKQPVTFTKDELIYLALDSATTDMLFTALMNRLQQENPHHCYFVDQSTIYPKWSIYHCNPEGSEQNYNIVAKEIKQ
jgi:hypothetical protein